jgi:hypothetical protein
MSYSRGHRAFRSQLHVTRAHPQQSFPDPTSRGLIPGSPSRSDGHRISNIHEIFPRLNDPLAWAHAQCSAGYLTPLPLAIDLASSPLLPVSRVGKEFWDPISRLLPSPRVPRPRQRQAGDRRRHRRPGKARCLCF